MIAGAAARMRVVVEIEEALGPGLDLELNPTSGRPIARRARVGGLWLGLDRGALAESDDGHGRAIPVVVALPAASFPGCRIEAELVGGYRSASGAVLVAAIDGARLPPDPIVRTVARVEPGAGRLDPAEAARVATAGRQAHRQRRSHARIVGGRAWMPPEGLRLERRRLDTPHSIAEYSLGRLPPRFIRGLEGLLDNEERILYWVERPARLDVGALERFRGGAERRAAVLLLTDRQLLWLVDHVDPNRYLLDWGVDATLIPVERLSGVEVRPVRRAVEIAVRSGSGTRTFRLPPELEAEVRVMADLIRRFVGGDARLPRRTYPVEPVAPDTEAPGRWHQADEAERLRASAQDRLGPLTAFLYSPRREGHPEAVGLALTETCLARVGAHGVREVALASVGSVELALSPLIGRLRAAVAGEAVEIVYPAALMTQGARFVRLLRRTLANRP